MAEHPTDMGMNKTGISLSPIDSGKLIEGAKNATPTSEPNGTNLENLRAEYIEQHIPVGSMPPPMTPHGIFSAAKQMIQGKKPTVLLDKLGERLAFERTGVRLYEMLIAKLRTLFPGDKQLNDRLLKILLEEMRHFQIVKGTIEKLGGDPTAMTPCADLTGVNSMGLIQTMSDPRTDFAQCLETILIAEAADNEGWDLLIKLAEASKEEQLLNVFRQCRMREAEHLLVIRELLTAATLSDLENKSA